MKKRILLLPAAVIVLGIAFLVGFHVYLERWSEEPLPVAEEIVFIVEPASSFNALAHMLGKRGVANPWLFSQLAQKHGLQTAVQSGEYRVAPGETPWALLDRLTRGDVVRYRFLVVEGSTIATVLDELQADRRIEFDLAGVVRGDLMERLDLPPGDPEGRFFPDTYQFKRGHKASSLLRRANHRMNAVLGECWAGRDKDTAFETRDEALILASIIEKETGLAADRPRVAGVFVRRLARGWRLQSDPTVIYGLGSAFDGNLTRAHLADDDNKHNTYRHHGLPPTPIALPGRAAIEAALHPADGEELYFVSRGDGSSEFSTDLEDHNKAVRRYQR
ncbi:MAG: endolytic transglycosylase MltG [Pseudomonadales bacterium]|nr:endolytic transglycosylase MltG [Pseudomonadales bacterium]